MESKICTKCKSTKSLDDFNKRKTSKDNKNHQCKDCLNTSRRKTERICLKCRDKQLKEENDFALQKEMIRKFVKERRDYIYETNPSNYEDWENRLRDYPWGYPIHLQDFIAYKNHKNKNLI